MRTRILYILMLALVPGCTLLLFSCISLRTDSTALKLLSALPGGLLTLFLLWRMTTDRISTFLQTALPAALLSGVFLATLPFTTPFYSKMSETLWDGMKVTGTIALLYLVLLLPCWWMLRFGRTLAQRSASLNRARKTPC